MPWGRTVAGLCFGVILFASGRYSAPTTRNDVRGPVRTNSKALSYAGAKDNKTPGGELPTENLADLQVRLSRTRPSAAWDEERLHLLAAWARRQPEAALDFARRNLLHDRQAQALTSIFEAWAEKNPAAAWDWVMTRENGDAGHLRTVLTAVAKNDPGTAERYAADYARQNPDLASNAYLAVLDGVMFTGNFEGAERVVAGAKVPDEEQRNLLLNFLGGQWASYQPEDASKWALTLPAGAVRDQVLDAVGQAWSDSDPVGAADFAASLPAGPVRQKALVQAISKWTLDDPLQASQWVIQYDAHQDFDQAAAAIATSADVMNRNVGLALKWADTIQQDGLRNQTTIAVLSTWYANDPASAISYIKTSPDLGATDRQAIAKAIPIPN